MIILDENMRQKSDATYAAILSRFRKSICTERDMEALCSRMGTTNDNAGPGENQNQAKEGLVDTSMVARWCGRDFSNRPQGRRSYVRRGGVTLRRAYANE